MTALHIRWSIVTVIWLGTALFFATNTVAVATFGDGRDAQAETHDGPGHRFTPQAPSGQLIIAAPNSAVEARQAVSDHVRALIELHEAAKSVGEPETPNRECR